MSLTNKSPAETYRDILYVANNNVGMSTSFKAINSGNGQSSALQLCDDGVLAQPINDDSGTSILQVNNSAGTKLLGVSNAGNIQGSAILDEDAMGSDSNTKLATQQSIKAYIDTYARRFYMNCSFYGRMSASNLYIVATGDTSQWHDTGGTSLTSLDGEALLHGSFFQANRNTTLVGAHGFIGTTTASAEDLTIYFLLSSAYTSDQTGSFTTASVGTLAQAGALGQNDAYYVSASINQAMTAGQVLLVGVILGTGSNKYVSGSLTLEFKTTD